jgi:hypothetical protein
MKLNEAPPGTKLPGGEQTVKRDIVKRLFDKEHGEAWDQIQGDSQLKGILGEFTIGFAKRDKLSVGDVGSFFRRFPTLDSFKAASMMRTEFLIDIERLNGLEKRNQYEQKFAEFERIMYGKSEKEE